MADWWNPFDDEDGAFMGSGDAEARRAADANYGRGDPRRGVGPDQANFQVAWDPNQAAGVGNQANSVRDTAGRVGLGAQQTAQDLNTQTAALTDRHAQRGMMMTGNAAGYQQLAATSGQDFAGADFGRAQGQTDAAGSYAGQLGAAAGRDTGSAAQAQLQQGVNEANAAAMSIAKSGNGFGGSAASMAQAAQQAPDAIARGATQAAQLRAQEDQASAQRQMQALDMAGQQSLAAGSLEAQMAQQQAALGLQSTGMDDERFNMLSQLGLGYGQLGMEHELAGMQAGLQGQLAGSQFGLEGMLSAQQLGLSAGDQQLAASMQGLQGAQAQQQAMQQYEQMLTDIYGLDIGENLKDREIDSANNSPASLIGGIAGAAGGVAALASDERMKTNVEATRLRNRYAALGGT